MKRTLAIACAATWAGMFSPGIRAEEAPKPADPLELGPFGIGSCYINSRTADDAARWVPQMQEIGLRYFRSGPTSWSQVQPKEGEWDWTAFDGFMDYLEERGFVCGGLLLGNVDWNKLDPPGTLPVNHLPAWSEYVTALVRHANGRVRRWEVWNEPPNGTGRDQTPADYAKIVVASWKAAKAVDPGCQIGIAAKSAHVNYLDQVIAAGAKGHFDYITLHPYEILNGIADHLGTEAVFMNIVPSVRKMLAVRDPAKRDVPIVFTELGCDSRKGADTQAHALVKAYTMSIAQGVTCMQWFEGRDGDSGPLGLLDGEGKPRPAYTAVREMIRHLGQKPKYLGWTRLNGRHYAFAFQGPAGRVVVTWAYRKETGDLAFGKTAKVVDPLSGEVRETDRHTLSFAPVLVLDAPEAWFREAAANQGKPLDWGGDFSKVKSVSLEMEGEKVVEKGLHTLSGDAVAKAVVAYGGSARAGNVPGGNAFVVDPTFLSYESTPIEITAVVRRNEANDNAGFKLVYESTDGFKTAENRWYTIPDNRQWHTVRWRIDDPQFVNYWGYNFTLESDGNEYNRYYIQSVTVTKLGK